ncbi:hypothetical protein [Vibrio amylolyticus]|uniref:hypothetical protein n=1 Tax=Vibrio amylolyticus TaxID=2847292 RepID=UPI00354B9F71
MSKYLVVASPSIGGAERRFFDIFKSLVEKGEDIYFIAPDLLLEKLDNNYEYRERIVDIKLKKWSYILFCIKLYFGCILSSSKEDVFHYPLNPPFFLHFLPIRKYSISYCYCYSRPKLSFKSIGLSLQRIAGMFAKSIDVLSPTVFSELKHDSRTTLTPGGTFVYSPDYSCDGDKRNVAIVSRLENGKGIDTYFTIVNRLKSYESDLKNGLPSFRIYGDGSMKSWVVEIVGKLVKDGVDIRYMGFESPQEIFKNSGLVFSLQDKTNYPSRVVIESLLSGSQVVVLNTGDSKKFGNIKGLYYLEQELTNLIDIVNTASDISQNLKSKKDISEMTKRRINATSYLDYYSRVIS